MPAIFAHRGASQDAPENTLKAFQLAMQQGADGIELDVHLTSDGQVVVIHDGELDRTTNGTGQVNKTTLDALRHLDAGEGERIPTLTEVFDLIGDKLTINIELKGFAGDTRRLPEAVVGLVNDFALQDSIIYSSFDPRMLIHLHRIDPGAKAGMLLLPGAMAVRAVFSQFVHPWSLHPYFESVTQSFMHRAKRAGYKVIAWTVDKKEDIQNMIEMGVAGIITDVPARALEVREALR